MIWNIIWPLMLVFSVVILPMWLWRRMKAVQQAAREALDDEPVRGEQALEETSASADGLNYGRSQGYDPVLSKASRDTEHVDDVKNLEGRR